ncbi:MAG: thioredoxin domain-containing protein [Cyclobacteriaceae bacterium]
MKEICRSLGWSLVRENSLKNRICFFILIISHISLFTHCGNRAESNGGNDGFNRLSQASSPYLREHADNPVDWYEWSPEALQKAEKENKPLIISIGYSSCHWCHVMEEESFMDTAVARLMNRNFISIKIDREERPDIDQIYLNAAQLISGNAGWPLNAFALPDGKPFYAATYYPKDQWLTLLQQIHEAYTKEKENVIKQAEAVTRGVATHEQIIQPGDSATEVIEKTYLEIFSRWSADLDYQYGGLNGSPKFPMPVNWEFGLQYHFLTGHKKALEIVTTTLDHMAKGGIYDHLGGGFSRYSTDSEWKVPHFEKMLFDNAQLVSLYAHVYQVTKNPLYGDVVRETLEFVKREMTGAEGGFYSSINADSEGEEGKFYTWTKGEIENILEGETAAMLTAYYNVSDSGNWEKGRNILYRSFGAEEFASRYQATTAEWNTTLREAKTKLLQARNARVRPSTDDKILTSWNALMLMGHLDAYRATRDANYLNTALKNAAFLENKMLRDDGGLWRNYKDGKANIDAFLDDYAFLSRAFIHLYQITFDIHWLESARLVADFAIDHFRDPETGMFYYTSDLAESLIVRKMEITDNVMPSSNSVLAEVLFLLGEYFQESSYSAKAGMMLNHILPDRIKTSPVFYANWARVAGLFVYQPFEVAVLGISALEKSRDIQEHYNPLAIFLGGTVDNLPLLENKYVDGKTIIYVCRNRICKLPVEDVAKALEQLRHR